MEFCAKSKQYFNEKIKQVFVYITSRCQLRCKQCLYKPLLCNNSPDLDYKILLDLLKDFQSMGAYKVSFLGGEPTLYNDLKHKKQLHDVVQSVKDMGYQYVRIDTNGQFGEDILSHDSFKALDEITFSLDGHDKATNDSVRGSGSYENCVANIKKAVLLGYTVQINTCVHKYSCPNIKIGLENLKKMILFAQELGVDCINFHPILKVGISRDEWIDDTNIEIEDWKEIYEEITSQIQQNMYKIKVRIPMRVTEKENILANRADYFYCPLEMGERALIMPDHQIKVCAFTIGTEECVARFDDTSVFFEEKENETHLIGSLEEEQVCYKQFASSKTLTPLCMSFKPNQKEIVWEDVNYGIFGTL